MSMRHIVYCKMLRCHFFVPPDIRCASCSHTRTLCKCFAHLYKSITMTVLPSARCAQQLLFTFWPLYKSITMTVLPSAMLAFSLTGLSGSYLLAVIEACRLWRLLGVSPIFNLGTFGSLYGTRCLCGGDSASWCCWPNPGRPFGRCRLKNMRNNAIFKPDGWHPTSPAFAESVR
jgi:hypothetical protein